LIVECAPSPRRVDFNSRLGQARNQMAQFRWARAACREAVGRHRPNAIVFMNLDAFDKVMALRGSPAHRVPVAGLMVSVRFHWGNAGISARSRWDALRERLFLRILRSPGLDTCFVIDDHLAEHARNWPRVTSGKVHRVPDPGEVDPAPRLEARRRLGLQEDAFIVLVYGLITMRKSVQRLVSAARLARSRVGNLVVLIVGQCDSEVRDWLQSPEMVRETRNGTLRVLDRFAGPEEERAAFGAADVLWVAYSPSFRNKSAVLSQGAQAGLPVIAHNAGAIAGIARENRMGLLVDVERKPEVVAALERIAEDSALREEFGRNSRRYGPSCSGEGFGAAICDGLERIARHD